MTPEEQKEKQREANKRWREKNSDYQKRWRAKNPEKAAAATAKWRAENREKYLAGSIAAYHRRDPVHVATVRRAYKIRRNYGVTLEEVERLLATQGNCCAICASPEPSHTNWVVDHHHATGMVRGILCSPCNVALRKDRDTIDHLRKALAYIERFESQLPPMPKPGATEDAT